MIRFVVKTTLILFSCSVLFAGVMFIPILNISPSWQVGLATVILCVGAYTVFWIHAKDVIKMMKKMENGE